MERGTETQQAADVAAPQGSAIGGQRRPPAVNPWFRLQQSVGNQAMSRVIQRKCACGGTCSKCAGDEDERRVPRLQLSSLSSRVQRAAKGSDHAEPPAAASESAGHTRGLIVDDGVALIRRGQMHRSTFFDLLEADICATADAVLAGSGRSTESCPYIAKWMAFYRQQSAAHLEQAILKYAPEAAEATSAYDYIRAVRHRVRVAVIIWLRSGRVTGVPPGVGLMPDAAGATTGETGGARRAQLKERQGADRRAADAAAVSAQLGQGRSLDPQLRGRMESAFGSDFSSVRVHDDSTAGTLSSSLNARAFTVGNKIAFGAGEYKPGTMVGDALIAHELAHVVQQGAAAQSNAPLLKGDGDYDALEVDADVSAIGAVASLWTGAKGRLADIGRNAGPRLKSGLKLQRCTGEKCAEGSWQVVNRAQIAGVCDCTWACVSSPSSGPSMDDPYRRRKSNPGRKHTKGVGGQNPRDHSGVCYCMSLEDSEGNVLGTDLPATPDQDYTAAAHAATGMTQGPYRPEQTTETKPRAAIIEKATPGPGDLEPLTPKAPGGGGPPAVTPAPPVQPAAPPPGTTVPVPPPVTPKPATPPAAPPPKPEVKTEPEVKKEPEVKNEPEVKKDPEAKTPPPAKTPSVADTQKRLEDIRTEKTSLDDAIREKYEKKAGAEERSRDAAAKIVKAAEADKQALRDKRDRNKATADRLQEEIEQLRLRRNALAAEEARLAPRVVKPQTWQEAEDALRKEFSGQKKRFILRGGNRDVDCFSEDRIAREAKFGPQGLETGDIRGEIAKDIELLRSKAVAGVEWHFYENVKGAIGPTDALATTLRNAGFRVVIHR